MGRKLCWPTPIVYISLHIQGFSGRNSYASQSDRKFQQTSHVQSMPVETLDWWSSLDSWISATTYNSKWCCSLLLFSLNPHCKNEKKSTIAHVPWYHSRHLFWWILTTNRFSNPNKYWRCTLSTWPEVTISRSGRVLKPGLHRLNL